jgi:hypothetical protein
MGHDCGTCVVLGALFILPYPVSKVLTQYCALCPGVPAGVQVDGQG